MIRASPTPIAASAARAFTSISSLSGQAGVVSSIVSATSVARDLDSRTMFRVTRSRPSSGSWTVRRASRIAPSVSVVSLADRVLHGERRPAQVPGRGARRAGLSSPTPTVPEPALPPGRQRRGRENRRATRPGDAHPTVSALRFAPRALLVAQLRTPRTPGPCVFPVRGGRSPVMVDIAAAPASAALSGPLRRPGGLVALTNIIVERGEGSWLDHRRMASGTSTTAPGSASRTPGHAHPRVVAAVAGPGGQAAPRPAEHRLPRARPAPARPARGGAPGGTWQAFLANSGAEAVEAAVKLARAATGRPAIVAFRGGFHGRTAQTMALTTARMSIRATSSRCPDPSTRRLPLLLPGRGRRAARSEPPAPATGRRSWMTLHTLV